MSVSRKIAVQTEDFDVGAEIAAVSAAVTNVGAVASFVGLCRGEGGTLDGVDLESYPAMAYLEFDGSWPGSLGCALAATLATVRTGPRVDLRLPSA